MTIIIPYKTKDSESYLFPPIFASRHLLEAGTFPKIVEITNRPFFKSKLRGGHFIRAWVFIRIFMVQKIILIILKTTDM